MKIARASLCLAAALALGGCPSNTHTHLVSAGSQPVWAIALRHGTIVDAPARFIQRLYRVRSGSDIVWQIEWNPDDKRCALNTHDGYDAFPSQLRFGETPACYISSITPRALEEGRAYRLESDDVRYNRSLHQVEEYFTLLNGAVRPITREDYQRATGAE